MTCRAPDKMGDAWQLLVNALSETAARYGVARRAYAWANRPAPTSKTNGPLAMDLKDSWGPFARLHLSHKGRLN